MNSSPFTSWEGVATCFTFADNPTMIAVLLALSVTAFAGFMYTIIKHENDAFDNHK
ncbi:hypothetical protein [Parathalassolituus penaei]|uniref:Uncharacterized protein n=1 Tax=Parathalassolituus penaei TaxID=2997323 RepID=A0A9X3IR73_9GAMM|nr:hypothetical protein [Parathalassolituus penaei]MCY0963935.1 hypothetical protein [Parathalassolituus penaei]